jgi:hypothetical protein
MLPQIPTLIPAPGVFAGVQGSKVGIDPKLLSRIRSLLAQGGVHSVPRRSRGVVGEGTGTDQPLRARPADRGRIRHEGRPSGHDRAPVDRPAVPAGNSNVDRRSSSRQSLSCRCFTDLGFSTVVGDATDVEAVELLSTSLLVQASTAMLGHGSVVDGYGTSRTRSFRQSFLVSFAIRIGQRLEAATERATTAETDRAGELVPLLRRQAERVDAAVDAMFPKLTSFGPSANNGRGWAAGRTAADLARLYVRAQVRSNVA